MRATSFSSRTSFLWSCDIIWLPLRSGYFSSSPKNFCISATSCEMNSPAAAGSKSAAPWADLRSLVNSVCSFFSCLKYSLAIFTRLGIRSARFLSETPMFDQARWTRLRTKIRSLYISTMKHPARNNGAIIEAKRKSVAAYEAAAPNNPNPASTNPFNPRFSQPSPRRLLRPMSSASV